ncbi:MAG: formylglycine-generating enzyme family protein [Treponema sp.]|nr:formylglycine-generating enzyme family protein [Treponema sp.]
MKKPVVIIILIIFFTSIFCIYSCSSLQAGSKYGATGNDAVLIPFSMVGAGFGYIDFNTLEIVIPPDYFYTGNFIGDFAVVQRRRGSEKYSVINKNNRIIANNMDKAVLIESVDRQTVYLLAINSGGIHRFRPSGSSFVSTTSSSESYVITNLHTGQVVFERTISSFDVTPTLIFFGNYFAFNRDVYEISNDGAFIKRNNIDADELAAQNARERDLEDLFHITKIDRHSGTFHWSLETFDMDKLLKLIPDNLRPYHYEQGSGVWENNNWQGRFINTYPKRPINRNEIFPLSSKEWLYQVNMISNEGIRYAGLYNSVKNEWEIPLVQEVRRFNLGEFYVTDFDEWIVYSEEVIGRNNMQIFFNLKTKEEVRNIFFYNKGIIYYDGLSRENNTVDSYSGNPVFDIERYSADLILIKGGTFSFGDPEWSYMGYTQNITLSPFYMSKYPVTQKEYHDVMRMNPAIYKHFNGENVPMVYVSWYDALEFCNRLSLLEGLTPVYNGQDWDRSANGYRLPTEAEWEYACRAGTVTPFNTGWMISRRQANFGNYTRLYRFWGYATPVSKYPPNRWGLYDMHGNVFEWCWDWYDSGARNKSLTPFGPETGSQRVVKGGYWGSSREDIRSDSTNRYNPSPHNHIGFRVVRNAE